MKGAKVLSKYAASRLKRSRELPSASHSGDVSGWLSFNSPQSAQYALRALSYSSFLSFISIASIGSGASILSIGKAGAAPGTGSVEPEPEILLEEEEILPEPEVLIEEEEITQEMPTTGEPRPQEMPPDPMP